MPCPAAGSIRLLRGACCVVQWGLMEERRDLERRMTAAYDAIAEWYDASLRSGSLLHDLVLPAVRDLIGPLAGQYICDLACGQGILTRQLAADGATVVGVDISDKLLDIARRDEAARPIGITYLRDDAQGLPALPDASFDGVVCNMALMDIPNLVATCYAVRRILRHAGWFVFSITHPCFQTSVSHWLEDDERTARVVGAYFVEGALRSDNPAGVRCRVGSYHRTLSTYVNTLADAKLWVERMHEPRATGEIAERLPGYAEVPALLVVGCRAAST